MRWKVHCCSSAPSNTKVGVNWVNAISRSQGVIEFDLTGHVLTANDNFLTLTGYSLDEITGRHHRMLVAPEQALTSMARWPRSSSTPLM